MMPNNFYEENYSALGLAKPKVGTIEHYNFVKIVKTWEIGKTSPYGNLTFGNRCKVINKWIPNRPLDIDLHDGKVFCGIFNKSGSRYLTASQDRCFRLYKTDDDSFKILNVILAEEVGWSILDVVFSPDQSSFAYSTWSSNIYVYPVNGDTSRIETCRLTREGRRSCIFTLEFSNDNKDIIAGSNDGILYIYDREVGAKIAEISAHSYDVNCVRFADESSNIIYSCGDDCLIKVWDRRTLKESAESHVGTLAGHVDGITFLDSKNDGRYLISNSKDQSIKLWDIRKFIREEDVPKVLRAVNLCRWDYRYMKVPVRLSKNRKNLPSDTSVMTYRGHYVTKSLIRCRFSPCGTTGQQFIYTGGGLGHVVVYDALTGNKVQELAAHSNCVRDLHWHPKRMEILTTSWDKAVRKWLYCDENEWEQPWAKSNIEEQPYPSDESDYFG